MTPQINLAQRAGRRTRKSDNHGTAEEIGVDCELYDFSALAGQENLTPVVGGIRRAALGCAALPDLDIENSLCRATGVMELYFDRERTAKLKYTVKSDPRLDQDFAFCCGGIKQDKHRRQQPDRRATTGSTN